MNPERRRRELRLQAIESQDALLQFLSAEFEISATLCSLAETTTHEDHRRRIFRKLQTAIDSIRHFEPNVSDLEQRNEIHAKADRLQKFISERNPQPV